MRNGHSIGVVCTLDCIDSLMPAHIHVKSSGQSVRLLSLGALDRQWCSSIPTIGVLAQNSDTTSLIIIEPNHVKERQISVMIFHNPDLIVVTVKI